jgi:hypothetical protein
MSSSSSNVSQIKKRSKRNQQLKTMIESNNNNNVDITYSAGGMNGSAMRRIRTPHPHDVLSGRGGNINSHQGNAHFREWVRIRKDDYNLAPSKADKARVAKEVIAIVLGQDPPGRFLQKDSTTMGGMGWWVELDEERVMAKTSQALREGAPQIRAAHKDELDQQRTKSGRRTRKQKGSQPLSWKRKYEPGQLLGLPQKYVGEIKTSQQKSIEELRANVTEAANHYQHGVEGLEDSLGRPAKQVRIDYRGHYLRPSDETPPLVAMTDPHHLLVDDILLLPQVALELPHIPLPRRLSDYDGMKRMHSLALSDMSQIDDWGDTEFVNPFEDESELSGGSKEHIESSPPRLGVLRTTSSASNGDMGGLNSLFRSESSKSSSSNSFGVRSRNSLGNISSRYDQTDPTDPLLLITPLDSFGWWDDDDDLLAIPVSP